MLTMMLIDHLVDDDDHMVDDDDDDDFTGKSCSKHGKIGWGQR